ncbi:MAG: hypothetical protein J5981_06310, partial [Lachnospira sp.]|nr:hypothetical protein [Lachnospira sp.]
MKERSLISDICEVIYKMKRYILKAGIIFIILAISLQAFALADVFTTQKTEGMSDCIYVAGSPEAYPIEYYDDETEKYSGIIPDLLELISKSTELDFVYINGNKESKEMLAENLQAEIVSSAQNIPEHPYYKDYAELVSYTVGNEVLTSGIIFTTIADDDTV